MTHSFNKHRQFAGQHTTNPGSQIYNKGMRIIDNKSRLISETKMFREHIELEGCSFKPKIFTKNSHFHKKEAERRRAHSMLDGSGINIGPMARCNQLYNMKKEQEEKLEQKRED